jgi:phage terminase large subunit-like protein
VPQTHAPRLLSWPTTIPKPLSCPPLTDAKSEGPAVISWIERHCRFGEGDRYGEPVILELFQKILLCWIFELRPDGRRRYRRVLIETPKGAGKTPLAAWVGAYMLATQHSAVIPVAAASYEQAELLFGDLRACVSESPTLSRVMVPFEAEIQLADGPGRAYKVAAIAGTNDGQRPSTFLADEIHEWIGPNRERVHLVLSNGCTKRVSSLAINVSTPGWDKQTVAGRLHDYGVRVNAGEVVDDEFLFVWWGCPADRFDLSTVEGLHAAIRAANPAADKFVNVADVAARYHQIPEAEWLRYHAGLWVPAAAAWLPAGSWDSCAAPGVTIPDGTDVCLGFDGSVNNDSTAIVAVSCAPVPHIVVVECWERPEGPAGDGWRVPIDDVEQTIRDACRRWRVKEIAADSYRWEASLQRLESEGLPVVRFPQTAAHMAPATARMYQAATNAGLTHDGDPRLARHVANAMLKAGPRGAWLTKETKYSTRRVDLAVATVMGFDRAAGPIEEEYDLMASLL